MSFIINILIFVIILSVIVIIHELGHLIAAKKFNVYCSEFAIGMGPVLLKYQKGETLLTIRALPIGGFVQMAGEEGVGIEGIPFERTINGIKTWKQIVVMAAGAFMNIMLALVVFTGIVANRGYVSVPSDPIIATVQENSPADKIGMQAGDKIVKMVLSDGSEIVPETFDDLLEGMANYKEGSVLYTVERDGKMLDFVVVPKFNETEQRYLVGFSAAAKTRPIQWYESISYGAEMMIDMTVQIIQAFGNLIRGVGLQDVSGPVGIYQATSQVAANGLGSLILWLGLLSLNIGVFNLLPVPILDGGRIVIALIEKMIGHRLSEKVQTIIMMTGLVLIVALMIYATANDIGRLF